MKLTFDTWEKVFKAKQCSLETMELKGYELIEEVFTDSSGFGTDNEPALSVSQFETKTKILLAEHGTLTAKITGVGQFQCHIGFFKKTGKSCAKRVANNTLLIEKDGKKIIRFHETDIITNENDEIILDNGGYYTKTTKERMNQYISTLGYAIYQKNYEWFIAGTGFGLIPYKNGIRLTGNL